MMKSRLFALALLCTLAGILFLIRPPVSHAQDGGCAQWGWDRACEAQCVQAFTYCQKNPDGVYYGDLMGEDDCIYPTYVSANECDATNCYTCLVWN